MLSALAMGPDWPGLSFLLTILGAAVGGVLVVDRLRGEVRALKAEIEDLKTDLTVLRGFTDKNNAEINALEGWRREQVAIERFRSREVRE